MKHCPACQRIYADNTLSFCLDDGAPLYDPQKTMVLPTPFPQPAPQPRSPLLRYFVIALICLSFGSLVTVLLMKDKTPGYVPPSNYNRAPTGTPSPVATPSASPVPTKSLLERQLVGSWKWNSFSQTFYADGTGQYYDDSKLCYHFKYTVKDSIMSPISDSERRCGPSSGSYRISISGDTMTMVYVDNGFETSWTRTSSAFP